LMISLSLSHEEEGLSYHFKVELNGKTVCTGIVVAKPLPDEIQGHDIFL